MQILGNVDPGVSAPLTAPTSLSAVQSSTSVAISFTAPTNDGGSAITNYEYSFNNSSWTALSPADAVSPVTVSGLTANTSYTIYLRGVNIVGSGPASSGVTFTTDYATFGSVEYLAINGGQGSTQSGLNGGTSGRWIEGSQTLLKAYGITVTVGAANSISVCGISDGSTTPSGGTLYQFGAGGQGAGDYNIGHNGGGGGGGAGGGGGNGSGNQGGTGGAGRATTITGSSATYAGGGGGGSAANGGGTSQAAGGSGGGGTGYNYNYGCANGTNGGTNTGSGGGGNAYCSATTGGSGRVVIAYPSSYGALTSIGAGLTYSLSTVSRSNYHVYTFTGGTGTVTP